MIFLLPAYQNLSQFQQQAIRVAAPPAMSFPMTFPTGVPITLQQQFPTQAQNLQQIQQTLNQSSPQPQQKGSHCINIVVIFFQRIPISSTHKSDSFSAPNTKAYGPHQPRSTEVK